MQLLSLRTDRLAVDLAPEAGGAIARFAVLGEGGAAGDVLRPASPEALASGTGKDAACYPLVPFSNRIANGRLAFDGEEINLAPNWPGIRHPIHGDGWSRAWTVARHNARSAELVYQYDGKSGESQSDGRGTGWPFRYRATQLFTLDEAGLTVRLSLDNLEDRPVPAGLGLHPFFRRDPDSELACNLGGVWRTDSEVLPVEHMPLPSVWDFSASRPVDGLNLDHCFDGWDGRAVITWPRRGLRLDLSATQAFRHLVIYVPARVPIGQPFFCVEPVSHANGAVGTTRLAAGATLTGEIAFRLSFL